MKKIIIVLLITVSGLLQAANGVFAINQVCKDFGCFPSDSTAGFPITISIPGSYILTSNLVSTSNSNSVIQIFSNDVTIDLNGFSIIGPRTCTGEAGTLACTPASGVSAHGISVSSTYHGIVIKNGLINGFNSGIVILTGSQSPNFVDNIISSENEEGIILSNGVISNSQANRNIRFGFSSTNAANNNGLLKVVDSYAYGNGAHSVHAQTCSNVFFKNNGTNPDADGDCAVYTNESICKKIGVGKCIAQ
jgi:hypothetical protein